MYTHKTYIQAWSHTCIAMAPPLYMGPHRNIHAHETYIHLYIHTGTVIEPGLRIALADQFGNPFTTQERLTGLTVRVVGSDSVISGPDDVTVSTSGRDFANLTLLKLDPTAVLQGCRVNKTISFVSVMYVHVCMCVCVCVLLN